MYQKNNIYIQFASRFALSIFDVRRKVRWVLESLSPGLLKNGKMNLCMSTEARKPRKQAKQSENSIVGHPVYLSTFFLSIYYLFQQHKTKYFQLHFYVRYTSQTCLVPIWQNNIYRCEVNIISLNISHVSSGLNWLAVTGRGRAVRDG